MRSIFLRSFPWLLCPVGVLSLGFAGSAEAAPADFWSAWGDGKAELSGYRLTQPRYGQNRDGIAVMIFVTEDFSDSARVKADPGKHPQKDVYPVLKLNFVRKFQTGIYDYSVMTSVFSRTEWDGKERPWPLRKVSFSSQEWCGHVYQQLLPPPREQAQNKLQSTSHSYFDGEADAAMEVDMPPSGIVADQLPVLLRSFPGRPDLLAEGASLTVPYLPTLLESRLSHHPLRWGQATLTRQKGTTSLTTPAGPFRVITYTMAVNGGETGTYHVEAAPPHRLVHFAQSGGEEGSLTGSARLPYWQLNQNGGESYLKQLGLSPLPRR